MPESVGPTDPLDHDSYTRRRLQQDHHHSMTARQRPRPRPSPRGEDPRERRHGEQASRPHHGGHHSPGRRSRSGSPSPSCCSCGSVSCLSCTSCSTNDDNAHRSSSRTTKNAIEDNNDRHTAVIPHPSLNTRRRSRRGSTASECSSDDGSSEPEEYTVYPDGRVHEHRRRGSGRREKERLANRKYHRRQDRGWDGGDASQEKEVRKRRSKEEAKGLLLAAVVFVASVILCWD